MQKLWAPRSLQWPQHVTGKQPGFPVPHSIVLGEKEAAAENNRDHVARDKVGHSSAYLPGTRMPVTKD